ncbi:hypothetical protein CEXT_253501 [Caerostris extrusa]|uniref:Uncharacterized protein n=1 Tax=Caerostris extrusa TaxID=172846 RepID=A0AAV4N2J2_CAEEX|nr:hypothetical protein CEXT_253501 [Caerostris extrusa]
MDRQTIIFSHHPEIFHFLILLTSLSVTSLALFGALTHRMATVLKNTPRDKRFTPSDKGSAHPFSKRNRLLRETCPFFYCHVRRYFA